MPTSTTAAREPYVFVSYASADRERVLDVVRDLRAGGVEVWLDQQAIGAGTNWGEEIADAIAGCTAFLLMSSSESLASRNVRQEIALAWKYGKPYLPLLLDATPFPREIEYWLETARWVDVRDRPAADWLPRVQHALERLYQTPAETVATSATHHDPVPIHDTPPTTARRVARTRHRVKPFLVGRDREQAQLEGWLEEALAGRGGLVLVGGEAGIGKTTLTSWLAWAAEEHGALVRVGGCYDLTTTPPYGPWVEITRAWPEEQGLPHLPRELREGVGLESVHSQAALFELIARFLSDASAARPLVLLLEDLHWADQASLDLLRYLARSVSEWPLLLVVTYRDDELTRRHPLFALLPTLAREPHANRLTLTRLDADAVGALVTSRYGLSPTDRERLVAYVQRLTEGNPFFAVEVLRALEDAGTLVQDSDAWQLTQLEQIHVPALVRQVIESRLARLGDETRRLLAVAAVIGHEVEIDLWVTVSGADDVMLADVLERATEAHLVEETADRTRLRFTHALVRETLYEGLVSLRVRAWHRQVGDALMAGANPSADAVAHHLQQAGDPRAFDWLVQAGDNARAAYAWFDAIARYEAAVSLVTNDPARVQERGWLLYRIAVLWRGSNPERARDYAEAALEGATEVNDRTLIAFATFIRGLMIGFRDDLETALPALRAAIDLMDRLTVSDLERSGPLLTMLFAEPEVIHRDRLGEYLHHNPGGGTQVQWLGVAGRAREAIELGEGYIAATDGQSLPMALLHQVADAHTGMALSHALLGHPDRSRHHYERSIAIYQGMGHHFLFFNTAFALFWHVHWCYNPDDPLERAYLQRLIDLATKRLDGAVNPVALQLASQYVDAVVADQWDVMVVFFRGWADGFATDRYFMGAQLGEINRRRGNRAAAWAGMHDYVPPQHDDTAVIGSMVFDVLTIRLGVQLHLGDGDLDGARAWLAAHDRFLRRSDAVHGRSEGALLWARYYQLAGDIEQSRAHAERAITHASDPRQPFALLHAHRFLGELLTELGELAAADEHLRASLTVAEAIGMRSEIAWTQLALAELHAGRGEVEVARALLAEVRAVFEPLGALPTLERVAALEARLEVG